jgi:16S rRNA (uracil1498-N3)-methyltransferase
MDGRIDDDGGGGDDGGGETKRGREGRWVRVAAAASKQCLRTHALVVESPCAFDALLRRVRDAPIALLAAAGAPPLRDALRDADGDDGDDGETASGPGRGATGGLLIVGPEGDFTEDELGALIDAGATPVGLGPLRLRVETAAVALMACVGMMHPRKPPPGC